MCCLKGSASHEVSTRLVSQENCYIHFKNIREKKAVIASSFNEVIQKVACTVGNLTKLFSKSQIKVVCRGGGA